MKFDTLSELVEAYQSGELPKDFPLIIDEENRIAFVENPLADDQQIDGDDTNGEGDNSYFFCLNIQQLLLETLEALGIPTEAF